MGDSKITTHVGVCCYGDDPDHKPDCVVLTVPETVTPATMEQALVDLAAKFEAADSVTSMRAWSRALHFAVECGKRLKAARDAAPPPAAPGDTRPTWPIHWPDVAPADVALLQLHLQGVTPAPADPRPLDEQLAAVVRDLASGQKSAGYVGLRGVAGAPDVVIDLATLPPAKLGRLLAVAHDDPDEEGPALCVAALVTDSEEDDARVLLVLSAKRGTWEMPGGRVRRREAPLGAVKRETLEEAGLLVEVAPVAPQILPGVEGVVALVYRGVTEGDPTAGSDVSDARWFAKDEIPWGQVSPVVSREVLQAWADGLLPPLPDRYAIAADLIASRGLVWDRALILHALDGAADCGTDGQNNVLRHALEELLAPGGVVDAEADAVLERLNVALAQGAWYKGANGAAGAS